MKRDWKKWFFSILMLGHCPVLLADQYCKSFPGNQYQNYLISGTATLASLSGYSTVVRTWLGGITVSLFNPLCSCWSIEPVLHRGEAVMITIVEVRSICFNQPTTPPTLPLNLLSSPSLNYVACQSNVVANFEAIVGRAPVEGTILYRLNPAEYRGNWLGAPDFWIYTFTNGAWSPTVPMAEAGEGVVIQQPGVFVAHPKALQPRIADGKFTFDVETVYGAPMTVEYSDRLSGGIWRVLTNIIGDGFRRSISDQDAVSTRGERYYRIRMN